MIYAALMVSAIVPSLLLLWYFHARDLHPEPGKVLFASFGLGVATIPGVLLAAWPLTFVVAELQEPHLAGLGAAFLTAAIPEELFKLVVVWGYAARNRHFDEPMDGIVYGVAVSLGFATLENVLYVGSGGLGVAVMRALTAVPGHAFFGAVMGYFVGQARFAPRGRGASLALAFVVPVLLHGLYDFPLLTLPALGDSVEPVHGLVLVGLALTTLVVSGVLARRSLRRLRVEQESRRAAGLPASYTEVVVGMEAAVVAGPGGMVVEAASVSASVVSAQPPAPPAPGRTWDFPSPSSPVVSPGRRFAGILLLLLGGLLATGGSLLILGIVAAFAVGEVDESERTGVLAGTAVIGLLPAAVGVLFFRLGLRRLRP